jgi:ParB family transcriptional regulator, chromosome partitioning protein
VSSTTKMRGLPTEKRMRHDHHFVDSLTRGTLTPVGRMIAVDQIDTVPEQPRRQMGDLADLVASIKAKGVLEPILVRKEGVRFRIIAGERRYRASRLAGLTQIPCIEIDVDDKGTLEISLIENLQRRDLSPVEEAHGIKQLCDKFLYTHEEVARRLGKSRSAITEILALTQIPDEVIEYCQEYGIHSRSHLLAIAHQPDTDSMLALAEQIRTQNLTRDDVRKLRHPGKDNGGPGRPKHFVFKYRAQDRRFAFSLRFSKAEVSRSEIIHTLRELLSTLESEKE